ncbi:serine kinase [Alphaproteobacteria bacterium GH1-50]|uniref:Serine kinase n=1 Tax=Kangsaoukella pontilimi TaxID=2691042 RepID=A0A7C9IGM7_9RHOB|nr:HPr kinase/phosphatase C-terminal domain-containing protein [Kangsaoukella pontilimi]MXQ08067.1 serine kinase [Kangsaoukella pontilimi]
MTEAVPPQVLHATAVAIGGKGLIIKGASGSGKSSLALELISRGAVLIADDRVICTPRSGTDILWLSPPDTIAGRIEARGLGLIAMPWQEAGAAAVVTLDKVENARLPERHETVIAGATLPLFHKVESPAFPAILMACLTGERVAP